MGGKEQQQTFWQTRHHFQRLNTSLWFKLIAWVMAASVTVASAVHDFSWALQLPHLPHTDEQSLEPKEWVLPAQGLHSGRPSLAGLPCLSDSTGGQQWRGEQWQWCCELRKTLQVMLETWDKGAFVLYVTMGPSLGFLLCHVRLSS